MAPNGFSSSNLPSTKWTKHRQIELLVQGHDPPIDIAIFMDIQPQSGPNAFDIRCAALFHFKVTANFPGVVLAKKFFFGRKKGHYER